MQLNSQPPTKRAANLATRTSALSLVRLKGAGHYHQATVGIDKEYRLSKVAKVSAFMYGHDIRICHGDALVRRHEAFPEIEDGTFDILVANPPFSVRGFLETLPESERAAYSLTDTIDKLDTANSIETFFLERAKQLLKGGGVAAIILPSSVLSNGNSTYIRAREILLQYFDIVAIVEFGSGTFGKTGTNTVTLFLRRKPTEPDTASHYLDRLNEWFGTDEGQDVYRDEHLLDAYATHIGVPAADYKGLLQGNAEGVWADHDHFEQYKKRFNDSGEVERLSKQRAFKALNDADKEKELRKRFLNFAHGIERDKLYHFVIASDQTHPVLIIRSPTDSKAQKQFLGYDWSASKGDEGIKIVRDVQGHHTTLLYDEADRNNPAKLNSFVSALFGGAPVALPANLAKLAHHVRLVDVLDFKRGVFEKQISLSPAKAPVQVANKWPVQKLGTVCSFEYGRPLPAARRIPGPYPVMGSNGRVGNHSEYFVTGPAIIIGRKGSAGEVIWEEENCYPIDTTFFIRPKQDIRLPFLFQALHALNLPGLRGGTGVPGLNRNDAYELEVAIPPLEVQDDAVSELKIVDREVGVAATDLTAAQTELDSQVEVVFKMTKTRREVGTLALAIQYGISESMNESGVGYKIFRMNEIVQRRMVDGGQMKCADISAEEFAKYKLNPGDLLFNRTNSIEHVGKTGLFDLEGDYCFASYLVRVVPDVSKVLPQFLVLMMNSTAFQAEAKGKASKSINQANINATIMRNIKVPAPPMPEQKRLVAKIQTLEKKIADAHAVIAGAPARKQAILQRYL